MWFCSMSSSSQTLFISSESVGGTGDTGGRGVTTFVLFSNNTI